jgi:membrane fusion protein, copper/silver efflux system
MTMMQQLRQGYRRLDRGVRAGWGRLPPRARSVAPYGVFLLVGLVIGSTLLGRTPAPDDDGRDGIRSAHGHDLEGEGIEWICAMHPQIRQPGPGQCPICGMDLVPMMTGDDEGAHGSLPRLTVSDRAAALMAVQVWPATRQALAGEVRLPGTIGYDETQFQDLIVRTDGQVERLHVQFENAPVRRGQRVADIYSPAVLAASQELLQARRAAAQGGMADLVDAAAAQLMAMGVTRPQVEQILETGEPARTYALYAPADGVVADLGARQGEWLTGGARVMRVAGLGRVWAQFEAYERDIARLRVGDPLQFTVEAFPGQVFSGTIAFIDPVVDGGRRTARVRATVANPDGMLKPGMLARGLATGAGSSASSGAAPLVVPATAPLVTGQRALVYVRIPDQDRPTFEPREVTLGARAGPFREITGGLAEGELVVVNGAFRIDAELQIRGRPSMMAGPRPDAIPDPAGAPGPDTRRVPVELSAEAGRRLEAVVIAYLDLARALSRDDPNEARTAAARLDGALGAAEPGGLDGDARREWNRLRTGLRARAATMAGTADLDVLRRELLPLSELLDEKVTLFRSDQVGPLFRAKCPMVEGGDGTWLTRMERVENPYHGAEMFGCGEVEGKVHAEG